MQSRFLAVVALLFSTLTLMATRAEADVYWSSIATACTPASVAIQDDRYSTTPDSTVAPKPGQLDPIVLICNVPQRPGVLLPHILSMTYLDSTGAGATAKVQTQLIRVQRSNGARAVVATVTSNSFPQTTTALHESGLFSHVMNFTTNFYYVRIEIDRAVANQNVRSIGVALETTCGDGAVSAHEACDDGAKVNGDGCSATCTVETGYECTGSPSVCSLLCGNAVIDAGESCDGADLGGEDCLSVPGGFTGGTLACTASCTFNTSACVTAVCGDGAINGSDTCDDGNAVNGDGCSSACTVEAGYQCTGEPSTCTLLCGNNVIDAGESCDGPDLGSETCVSIPGGFTGGTLACNPNCTFDTSACVTPVCGDGVIAGGEGCDDANVVNGDGCSATCTIEGGYSCLGQPSTCTAGCGDGIVAGSEICDDGNTANGDGCSAVCTLESGWSCPAPGSPCSPI